MSTDTIISGALIYMPMMPSLVFIPDNGQQAGNVNGFAPPPQGGITSHDQIKRILLDFKLITEYQWPIEEMKQWDLSLPASRLREFGLSTSA